MQFGRSGAAIRRSNRAYAAVVGSAVAGAQIANEALCVVFGTKGARPVFTGLSLVNGSASARFQPRALCSVVGDAAASAATTSQYSNGFAARRVFIYPGTLNDIQSA